MPVVSCSDGAFGTVTFALVPLNTSALPNLPVVQVVPLEVPLLFCPEASRIAVPVPSSNPYAATRPVVVCARTEPASSRTSHTTMNGTDMDRGMRAALEEYASRGLTLRFVSLNNRTGAPPCRLPAHPVLVPRA